MTADTAARPSLTSFEFKSAFLSVVALVLKTTDMSTLQAELEAHLAAHPGFFEDDALLIDLAAVRGQAQDIDFERLTELLVRHDTLPVAVRGGSPAQHEQALGAGLAIAPEELPVRAPPAARRAVQQAPASDGPAATLVLDKPLRAGQQVYARGGDLLVLAAVNPGAEVIADGHIHVYAPLRGRAIAGARGNAAARILTTCLEPQLMAIAGVYRTAEQDWPQAVAGKPAQVRLRGGRLDIEPLA